MVWRFNAPPGWPAPPTGWVPPPGWAPDPTWPAPPPGWQFWIGDAVPGEATRTVATGEPAVATPAQVQQVGPAHLSWHERRQERHAEHDHAVALAGWQAQQDLADELARAAHAAPTGGVSVPGLMLKRGEVGLWAAGAALIEPRVQQGHYVGGYSGVSLHIAKGVNYRVGGTRGYYVPGPEVQTPVDRGQVSVTSQRVVFTGTRTTREWLYAKMIGTHASSDDHTVLLHVSNRQKVSGLTVGAQGSRLQAYMALGIALGQDDAASVAQRWSQAADAHRSQRP
ncbi:MAG: hypothetical protein M3N95_11820 [Actinomycetota bacterium]|nr:hypothetical protein [Actinomycetota bacterium]